MCSGRGLACIVLATAACGDDRAAPADSGMSHWSNGPGLPSRRLEPGVAPLGDRLVVAGGFDTSASEGLHITTTVDVLDTATNEWLPPLPALPVAWTHMNLAASGDTLYLLGGLEGAGFTARGTAWALDPDATAWRPLASLPSGHERGASGVIATSTTLYLIGGASTADAIASCLAYDIATDTWSELPALPGPRSHPAAMALSDGTLVAATGLETLDSNNPVGDVLMLAPGATAWETTSASLARPRGGCAYGLLAGGLICAGGELGSSASRRVDLYDPAADTWTALDDLPEARAGTQGAAIGSHFYVVGGASALVFQPLTTTFVFSL